VDHGWVVESIPRHSQELLIFSVNGEVRGQILVNSEDEKRRWLRVMKKINEPLEPESTYGTLITK
jgi:hypothetical protein